MNKFKITPKIALIIVLVVITIVGIFMYLRYNNATKNNPAVADNGFLSFFGGRKVKPNDESTIPGVIPNQGGATAGLTSGLTAGEATSGDTGGSGTSGINNNGGKITLRPIGGGGLSLNDNNNSGGDTSGNTNGGATTGDSSGGNGTGNTNGGTTGGTNTGGNGIPQVDCTPPTLPYTQAQVEELKSLTQRFYRISANLHTAADIENEIDTQKSYYDLYQQAKTYTNQCYSQLSEKDKNGKLVYGDKAQNANAKNHPYITDAVLQIIAKYDPRVILVRKNDTARIDAEINALEQRIAMANVQYYFLEHLGTTLTPEQQAKKDSLKAHTVTVDKNTSTTKLVPGDIERYQAEIDYKKNQRWAVQNTKLSLMYGDVLGTFFGGDTYKFKETGETLQLKVPRANNNTRYNKLWNYTNKIIQDRGQGSGVIDQLWTVGSDLYQYNPLKMIAQDKVNDLLDDAPRDEKTGNRQSFMNRFIMLEDGLRIW